MIVKKNTPIMEVPQDTDKELVAQNNPENLVDIVDNDFTEVAMVFDSVYRNTIMGNEDQITAKALVTKIGIIGNQLAHRMSEELKDTRALPAMVEFTQRAFQTVGNTIAETNVSKEGKDIALLKIGITSGLLSGFTEGTIDLLTGE